MSRLCAICDEGFGLIYQKDMRLHLSFVKMSTRLLVIGVIWLCFYVLINP